MHTLQLSNEVYERLLRHVRTFDDTAEDVIVRLLDAAQSSSEPAPTASEMGTSARSTRSSHHRAAPGSILPEREYWPAIHATLIERGGRAHANDVIERVGELLRDRLRPADFDDLEIGEIRWRNRTRFARLRMKEAGLLRTDSPRGIWELSDRGRTFAPTSG